MKEIFHNTYVSYTEYPNGTKLKKISCDHLQSVTLSSGTKIYYVAQSDIIKPINFDSLRRPLTLGMYIIPLGFHAGGYLSYYLNSRNIASIRGGYKIKCPQGFDEVLNFTAHKASSFYSGPVFQAQFEHLKKGAPHGGIRSINVVYDFRYRIVGKYTWLDGPSGQSSTYQEERSEQVYAHTVLFLLSTTYKLNEKLNWGLFLGGGIQWGHKRIHHYASDYHPLTPTNLYDRFSSEPLFPLVFRMGLFLNLTAKQFGKRN